MSIHFRDQHQDEKGVALLLALFALILISAVGVAIVFMSTGETSIAANQRSNVTAWEAAKGGLEEARSRMSKGDPNYIGDPNQPLDKSRILYIVNPNGAADPVQPSTAGTPYFDTEYQSEWGVPITTGGLTVTPLNSDMQALLTGGTINRAPPYKWVRVTSKTAFSVNQDISGSGAAPPFDNTIPVYYNGTRQNLNSDGVQVFVLTARAVLPNGTRKTLSEEVAPDIPFPISATVSTTGAQTWGAGWTGTGLKEASCNKDLIGANAGAAIGGEAASGNVTGSPAAIAPNMPPPFPPYNIPAVIQKFSAMTVPIDIGSNPPGTITVPPFTATNTGVYRTTPGSPGPPAVSPTYGAPSGAMLGTQAAPAYYYSNGNLTLGPGIPVTGVSGGGVLLVKGDLTIDVANGFSYYGLIVATGNIKFFSSSGGTVTANFHGAIIGGGTFDAPPANLSGTNQMQGNPCLVNDMFARRPWHVLAFREITD